MKYLGLICFLLSCSQILGATLSLDQKSIFLVWSQAKFVSKEDTSGLPNIIPISRINIKLVPERPVNEDGIPIRGEFVWDRSIKYKKDYQLPDKYEILIYIPLYIVDNEAFLDQTIYDTLLHEMLHYIFAFRGLNDSEFKIRYTDSHDWIDELWQQNSSK